VAGIGPVLLNTLPWATENERTDVFAVCQLPLPALPPSFLESVAASRQLLVVEEHAARGGLGEYLAAALAREGIAFRLHHRHAAGYPAGRYGSQSYHQQQSGLDKTSLQAAVAGLIA
jgi:transketolase